MAPAVTLTKAPAVSAASTGNETLSVIVVLRAMAGMSCI